MVRKYTPKNKFPKLTADQRAAIVALKNQKKVSSQVMSDRKIAEKFNCDPKTVRNVFKKWQETGKVTSVKQQGRKRILTDKERDELYNVCHQFPFYKACLFRDSEKLNLKHVSVDTVKRELRRMDLSAYVARTKDLMDLDHRVARVNFAEKHKDFDWTKVVFSDEKILQNHCHARQYVRRPRGHAWKNKYIIRMKKTKRFKVNLWGFIRFDGCGLVNIEGEMEGKHKGKHTRNTYLEILKKINIKRIASRRKKMIFMQDNASVHTAKVVKAYLKSSKINVLDWPALSPDLNPIENVWSQMQKKVYERMRLGSLIKNKEDLLSLVKRCFFEVCNPKYLSSLYNSMPKRIRAVIDQNGQRTKY